MQAMTCMGPGQPLTTHCDDMHGTRASTHRTLRWGLVGTAREEYRNTLEGRACHRRNTLREVINISESMRGTWDCLKATKQHSRRNQHSMQDG